MEQKEHPGKNELEQLPSGQRVRALNHTGAFPSVSHLYRRNFVTSKFSLLNLQMDSVEQANRDNTCPARSASEVKKKSKVLNPIGQVRVRLIFVY